MGLIDRINKLKQEREDLTDKSSYLYSSSYETAIHSVKSKKFSNLEYVNRVEHWQFYAPVNDKSIAECVYSRFGAIDLVFDDFIKDFKDKIDIFYINILHNPNADFHINRMEDISVPKSSTTLYMSFIPPLEICRTSNLKDNTEVHNEFVLSKKYKIMEYSDSFFRVEDK